MIVVAGPPGSGKSSVFPFAQTGVDHFNIDERGAELNGGSYQKIPPEIRAQSNRECDSSNIRGGRVGLCPWSRLRPRPLSTRAQRQAYDFVGAGLC